MSTANARRYPLADLLYTAHLSRDDVVRRLELIGVSSDVVRSAERAGGLLTEAGADRVAVACGFVPYVVWPDWITDVIDDCSIRCNQCGRMFVPEPCTRWGRNRLCSEQCARHARRQAAKIAARTRRGTPHEQTCRWCSAVFPTEHDRRYCCDVCRASAVRHQQRETARRARIRKRAGA